MPNLHQILNELNILIVPVPKCECDFPVKGKANELRLTYMCVMCERPIPLEWAENYQYCREIR